MTLDGAAGTHAANLPMRLRTRQTAYVIVKIRPVGEVLAWRRDRRTTICIKYWSNCIFDSITIFALLYTRAYIWLSRYGCRFEANKYSAWEEPETAAQRINPASGNPGSFRGKNSLVQDRGEVFQQPSSSAEIKIPSNYPFAYTEPGR